MEAVSVLSHQHRPFNKGAPTCKRERGFTLIEIVLVLGLAGVVMAFAGRAVLSAITEYRIESTIEEARNILEAAEMVRRSALTTTIDADGVYTHTYPTLAADSPMSALNALLPSGSTGLPETSPFGTPYAVEITAQTVFVSVDVPDVVDLNIFNATSTDIVGSGGERLGTRLTFRYGGAARSSQMIPAEVLYEKGAIYLEQAR